MYARIPIHHLKILGTNCEKKTLFFRMLTYVNIISPLDQFEIRNLFSIDTPLLGNINLSITNIGLYMTLASFLAFGVSVLATNYSKVTPNK